MAAGVGDRKSQVFPPTYWTLNSLMQSKDGPSATKKLSYTPAMAVFIGPASEVAHLTPWSASFSRIVRMVGQWVLAGPSFRMAARKRQGSRGRYCSIKQLSVSD